MVNTADLIMLNVIFYTRLHTRQQARGWKHLY